MNTTQHAAFDRAATKIPGGVNSPVRSFKSVGGYPMMMSSGSGPYIFDDQGQRYLDLVLGYGPLILGHAHPEIVKVIEEVSQQGVLFGACHHHEYQLAAAISEAMPSIEQVRLTNSGTEACATAIRLARGYTQRQKILIARGSYHGCIPATLHQSEHPPEAKSGILPGEASDTLVADYNDIEAFAALLQQHEVAAVMIEPVAGNMGCVLPQPDFLPQLRKLCDQHGTVLIFDEVMTGFRVSYHGAQGFYQVKPDLTCLGKVIGGGFPVGAVGGDRRIMQCIAPLGDVYHAGTFAGNPMTVKAGLKTLQLLKDPAYYQHLEHCNQQMIKAIHAAAAQHQVPCCAQGVGGMLGLAFSAMPVRQYDDVVRQDHQRFKRFFHSMLQRHICLPPSSYEAFFLSTAMTKEDITSFNEAVSQAFAEIAHG